ncbi:TonB-dependent receptor domain-containing protein [Caulobacter segnis]|uniref:TonB-dependent receptor domain-containing protein n=1 Tax=Caulobacter segnis TaxID=88688 RepID=UPI002857CAF7|nr:TonB-dependent receptor [Caulobacter segnis]MDR6624086.1 iron complex outermembrane receptor protein [Caulobacter segnis]
MHKNFLLGTTVITGALSLMAVTAPAHAQTAAPAAPAAEANELEAITVTGSRIRRSEFTASSPIQVLTAERAELEGSATMSAILQNSTLAAGTGQINNQYTGYNVTGGPGVSTVSLRGLGANRTLVLLNGRRAGPAGVRGQVGPFDLGVVPESIVERVEILKDGASSIYGSDAVAGVVNIITRKKLDGGELKIYGSNPLEKGGKAYRMTGAYGKTFDKGYFNVSGEYFRQEILRRGDRDDTACAADYLFDPKTGARKDYKDAVTGQYKCLNLTNGYVQLVTGSVNLVPIVSGINYPSAAQGNNSTIPGFARFNRIGYPDTYTYAPTTSPLYDRSSTVSPEIRSTVAFNGGYQITPNVEAYTELMISRRQSSQTGVGQIFQSFAQRNTLNGALNYLPASNPNNTIGQNAVTVAAYESNGHQDVKYYRAVAGLRGSIDWNGGWDWDIFGQYSKSDATYDFGPRIYLDRFAALNSPNVACTNNPAGGNFSNFNCSQLPNGIPWMSNRVLAGQFTQAERDFLFFEEEGTTEYSHAYVEGSISGDLFSLPTGPVAGAFGFQVRKERINDKPGYQAANRNMALYSSAGQTKGSDSSKEVFGELDLPLVRDARFMERLDVNLSARYSDYDSYGSDATWKVGANWKVLPSVTLRFTHGTSFRAPSLYELYLGNQIGYSSQSVIDPCYDLGNSSTASQTTRNNCASQGIPTSYNALGGSSATVFSTGGQGNLKAETAAANTFGIVWSPRFADLNVAVDYFTINVDNEVRQFGAANILKQCYNSTDFPTNPFCSLFTRDPSKFYILSVQNSYVNVANQVNHGIDLTTQYSRDLLGGRLSTNSQFTWTTKNVVTLLGGATPLNRLGTTYNYDGPGFSGNISATWKKDDWTFYWGVNMIGKGSDTDQPENMTDVLPVNKYTDVVNGVTTNCSATVNACAYYNLHAELTVYHTFSVKRQFGDLSTQIGVNNAFDERPPAGSSGQFRVGTAQLGNYDMIGRRIFVAVTKKW